MSKSYMSSTESICAFFPPPLCLERSYCHRAQGSRSVHVSWEFICNIGFEYDLLRGRRLWRWTAAVSVTPSLFTPPLSINHITFHRVTNEPFSFLFFSPTDLHCLSALYHLPSGHRSRRLEFAPPNQLQGTLSHSFPQVTVLFTLLFSSSG